ncbi:unnamed protein product [Arctia plantaginis]|uniref:Uncharacterized protein n=1 Tax=Arctia plantaginis TaxID=874455 RepID=A0A8S1BB05_ARCPL|nr:unnamed protein product [Arctia plantaginis]
MFERKTDVHRHMGGACQARADRDRKVPVRVHLYLREEVPVPVPVFCRPIAENEPRMTLLCAAAVNLNGGRTPDGGCMIGESVFYANQDVKTENTMSLAYEMSKAQLVHSPEVEEINQQIESTHNVEYTEKNLVIPSLDLFQ